MPSEQSDRRTKDLGIVCDVAGCEERILALEDGWEFDRGVVCAECIKYSQENGHWPDEDRQVPREE